MKDFADVAGPMHELTKKGKQFPWTDKCEESFQKLKQKLTEAPVVTQNLNVISSWTLMPVI